MTAAGGTARGRKADWSHHADGLQRFLDLCGVNLAAVILVELLESCTTAIIVTWARQWNRVSASSERNPRGCGMVAHSLPRNSSFCAKNSRHRSIAQANQWTRSSPTSSGHWLRDKQPRGASATGRWVAQGGDLSCGAQRDAYLLRGELEAQLVVFYSCCGHICDLV